MFEKLGKYAVLIVVVGVAILAYSLHRQTQRVRQLEQDLNEVRGLAGGNVLPEHVYLQITELQNQVQVLERRGPDSVFVTTHQYIPVESQVQYIVEQDTLVWRQIQQLNQQLGYLWAMGDTVGFNQLNQELQILQNRLFRTKVVYDKRGWCSVPFIGAGINNELEGELNAGLRLAYWNRFGVGVQGDITFPEDTIRTTVEWGTSVFADWRIPHLNNTAIYGGLGRNWTREEWQTRFGLHLYLN